MNRNKILQHIEEIHNDIFLLYIDDIKREIVLKESGIDLRIPSQNTDWAVDTMKLSIELCKRYNNYFIVGHGSGNEVAGYISLYVQGI